MITIVGIGNELRGDDAAALFALRGLKELLPPQVRLVELTGDQLDLINLMRETDNMIIIDAVSSTAPTGTIFRINAGDEPFPKNFFTVSSHGIDLAESIELARAMKVLPGNVLIYGIAGKDFSFSTSLSQRVKDAADVLRNELIDDVTKILKV